MTNETDKIGTSERPPVWPGYDDDEMTHAWCDFCRRWHRHGVGDPGVDELRGAHCLYPESPYHATGYITCSVERWSPEVEAQHRDEMRRGARAHRVWVQLGGPDARVSWVDVWEGRVGSVGSKQWPKLNVDDIVTALIALPRPAHPKEDPESPHACA